MKVEAHSILIENLFKKGKFIVPNYQREFDWDDTNINEFLDDISEIIELESYFIGHMVFEGDFNGQEFIIIDGQQRITTITILLCILRDRFMEIGENNLANAINDSYVFGRDLDYKEYPRLENRMPYPVLQAYVQSKPSDKNKQIVPIKKGEKKIVSAYDKFYKFFSKLNRENLISWRNRILNLETIFVAATGLADASTIFMTLNATGKDLTPLDLVKNFLFSKYPILPHIDEPNDTWKLILENTSGSDKFLNNSIASRYKKVSDKRIFKEIIRVVNNKDRLIDAKTFLENLKIDAELYNKITKPQQKHWLNNDYDIFESIKAIVTTFKIDVANAFLIALLRDFETQNISKSILMRMLYSMERFHFVNNAICSNRSSGFDKLYAKKAKLLYEVHGKEQKHNIILNFIPEINKKMPGEEEFDANFDKKVYYSEKENKQKNLVQYILNKIERNINPNAILINTSIEHIYPENPKSSDINVDLIKKMGNLVILDSGLNSSIGNKSYEIKKEIILRKSKIISTKNTFISNEKWEESNIEKRNKELKSFLYKDIW